MDSNAASDEIKSLSINGLFDEVESKFGKKKTAKAVNYVEVKLQSLRDKRKSGLSLENVLYATPFMIYAIDKDGQQVLNFSKSDFPPCANFTLWFRSLRSLKLSATETTKTKPKKIRLDRSLAHQQT